MAGTQAKASPCPPAFLESPDPPVRPPTSSPNPENGVWGPGSCKPSHILIQPHLELGGLGEGEVGGGALADAEGSWGTNSPVILGAG